MNYAYVIMFSFFYCSSLLKVLVYYPEGLEHEASLTALWGWAKGVHRQGTMDYGPLHVLTSKHPAP